MFASVAKPWSYDADMPFVRRLPAKPVCPGPARRGRLGQALGLGLMAGLVFSPSGWATEVALPAPIARALKDSGLPDGALSVWVQGADQAQPRLAFQAEQPRQMASVMKLFTTGAALRLLGPTWRWKTQLALGGPLDAQGWLRGDLWVQASGDPSLDFDRLMAQLRGMKAAGLTRIGGQVRVDRRRFEVPAFDSGAFDGEPLKPYNAGPETWMLAHQAVSLRLRPDTSTPEPLASVQVSLLPPLAGVTVINQVVPVGRATPCGDWRAALTLTISQAAPPTVGQALPPRTVTLQGRYPLSCEEQNWPLRWPAQQPMEHAARVFRAAWQELGGQLDGEVVEAPWPSAGKVWMEWPSPPLSDVVRDINKFSNNVMARQLFLTLALDRDGRERTATLERAREVVAEHVRRATQPPVVPGAGQAAVGPCEGARLTLDNGSGLSRAEGSSTACLARWVQVMWQDATMPEWLASLPVAGVDGTARRMNAAVGRAHLKTGSLDNVASLAGIVQDNRGQRHVVVAVINDPRAASARAVLQAVVAWAGEAPP